MKKISTCILTFYLTLAIDSLALAQLKNFNTEINIWLPGKVILFDGAILKGSLNYNFITSIISVENETGTHSFMANKAKYFEIQDSDSLARKYYSLPYEIRKNKAMKNTFFEFVYENKKSSIAILSRHEYDYLVRGTGGGKNETYVKEDRTIEMEKVTEILYLATGEGQILELASKKKDKSTTFVYDTQNDLKCNKYASSRTRRYQGAVYKITNSDALNQIGGVDTKEIVEYCKSEGYKLNTIEGLIHFLDYSSEFGDKH